MQRLMITHTFVDFAQILIFLNRLNESTIFVQNLLYVGWTGWRCSTATIDRIDWRPPLLRLLRRRLLLGLRIRHRHFVMSLVFFGFLFLFFIFFLSFFFQCSRLYIYYVRSRLAAIAWWYTAWRCAGLPVLLCMYYVYSVGCSIRHTRKYAQNSLDTQTTL